jgi:hypothetical protein
MRANTIGLIAGTIAVVSTANSASAGLVIGDVISVSRQASNGRLVTINFDYSRASNASAVTGGNLAMAGTVDFTLLSVNSTANGGGTLTAFCVEINEGFPDDPIDYTLVAPTSVPEEVPPNVMTSNQSQMMQDLYSRYYADVMESGSESWVSYTDEMAAFQLVIWEISHENFSDTSDLSVMKSELDITLGAMQATDYYSSDVLNAANAMITALGTGGWNNFGALLGGTNPTNQDLLIVVPSPAIAALAGLGLVGMRRRRR